MTRLSAQGLLVPILGVWWLTERVQSTQPVSLLYAVLDEVAHLAVGLACIAWFVPAWGYGPLLWTAVASTSIDLDHVVAARSFDPEMLLSLGARPPTHSLVAAAGLAVVFALVGGYRTGIAVLIGLVTHVLRDAAGQPGVPLLVPFDSAAHVVVPRWTYLLVVFAFAACGALIAQRARDRPRARCRPSRTWWARRTG